MYFLLSKMDMYLYRHTIFGLLALQSEEYQAGELNSPSLRQINYSEDM